MSAVAIRILLVDDHPIFRSGVRALLEAEPGLEVVGEAEDGAGGVSSAGTLKPDLVVIDISMPGMNGLDAARRITSKDPGVKVLCLSVHSDKQFVAAALRSGVCGYLLKDSALEVLVKAVRAVVEGHIYLSPGLGDLALDGLREGSDENSIVEGLTPREREVLQLLVEGHPAREIAEQLQVSVKTVATHREHLMEKIGTRSLAGLTKFAIREGLTSSDE